MKYVLNASAMLAPFFVPASVVDKHIKLATANQLRVLLTFLKNVSIGPSPKFLAETLNLPESEVLDALNFWVEREVISAEGEKVVATAEAETPAAPVRSVAIKPSREEVSAAAMSERDDMLVTVTGNDERILLVSLFDNLGKGASGAAIQNMNIVLGVAEETGLVIGE